MKALILFCAALCTIAPSTTFAAETEKDGDDLTSAYMLCVRRAAIEFEPSGDKPDDVAKAAVWSCMAPELSAMNFYIKHPEKHYEPTELRTTGLFIGAAQAVGARLCRKTGNCAHSKVP
jgi:hypothetical protein